MNENEGRKKREWVKNAAIIFLTIMLLLTFFSNTIMNYSLPEVATQYVQSGSITAKVRGTGNVEANDPYKVMVKETRVVSAVAVKKGDVVEKDQVLYYLEDEDSDELKKAQDELEELELAYMKGLFGSTVSPEIISKVASGRTDSFASYQAMVTDMQGRLDAAQARVKECQDTLDNLTLQSTVNTNNATINTIPEEDEKLLASNELSNAQSQEAIAQEAFNRMKTEKSLEVDRWMNDIKQQITEKENQIKDLEQLIDGAESITGSVSGTSKDTSQGTEGEGSPDGDSVNGQIVSAAGGIDVYIERREAAKKIRDEKFSDILTAAKSAGYNGEETIHALKAWIDEDEGRRNDYSTLVRDYDAAQSQYEVAVRLTEEASAQLNNHDSNESELERRKSELKSLNDQLAQGQDAYAEIQAMVYTQGESVKDAQARLQQADKNLSDKNNANKQASVAYQNQLATAEAALKNAQAVYELLKTEQTELSADINAELDLSKDIADKREEIAKLKEKSIGSVITAPVAGTVASLAYTAGETTNPEEAAAVLQAEGKGYTMSISVTNEQAKKVQVGDTAELQNAWYYDDVQAVLATIRPDPDNPSQNKQLTFNITGTSVQAGQSLSLSVGQRSSEYEFVVPNSAVREDNNGKFILIVESKSGPINNRYIATRVDVEVLASDDTNTAISAALYGYEYVITTSTKPVEAGKQVRLNES